MSEGHVPFGRVGILGLGVMGGSLARALSALPDGPTVVGWSPDPADADAALEAGIVTHLATGPEAAAEASDLLVLAAPLAACLTLMEAVAPHLLGQRLVTDVASLKAPLAESAHDLGLDDRWVGSHPMCGSADSGFGAARPDLFLDAKVWLCAHEPARGHLPALRRFWISVGAVTAPIAPLAHDRLMGRISHLPQLTANALAATLEAAGVRPGDLGPGAADMTRLAGSSPDMWGDLLARAPVELPDHLRDTADRLRDLADLVERGEVEALVRWMAGSRVWRTGP
ncbi:MAG TPA: prephenate dehydrogenase/arogenate dehydrogenase family protein [Longimicrobiales bacterium]|nr:prephenate dehydrogenase/arogenate dehydrogenase family protein [Longimicrobiales bacterium]